MNFQRFFIFLFALSMTTVSPSAYSAPNIETDSIECDESFTRENAINITLDEYSAKDLMSLGADSLIAKLTPNVGKPKVSSIARMQPNSRYTFEFVGLSPQKYLCQIAAISAGIQGPWSDSIEIRLGEIPTCDYGYIYTSQFSIDGEEEIDKVEKCRKITWTFSRYTDGFAKYFSIRMEADDSSPSGSPDVQIFCDKKRIEVYVWAEYADSFGWNGSGLVKFDKGNPKKISYRLQKDFDGIALKDPRSFMANLIKANSTFGFKIPVVDGYAIPRYPVGNLLDFRQIFAKSGCKF